jgi:hypothetical protein
MPATDAQTMRPGLSYGLDLTTAQSPAHVLNSFA